MCEFCAGKQQIYCVCLIIILACVSVKVRLVLGWFRMKKYFGLAAVSLLLGGCVSSNGFPAFIPHSQGDDASISKILVEGKGEVEQFSIEPGCIGRVDNKGRTNGGYSDCDYGSVRSEVVEDVWEAKTYGLGQPKSAWYGWEVFLPPNFPNARQQQNGKYLIGQWHNGQCPHLSVVNPKETNAVGFELLRARGNYECQRAKFVRLTSLSEMRGRWTKFEFFVRWDEQKGEIIAYVDGIEKGRFNGRTLVKGLEDKNSFRYGLYLCCTDNINSIEPTFVRFSNVSRADAREMLLVNAKQ